MGLVFGYYQPYYGPSGLRFNAKAGTTYLIAVDTKNNSNPVYGNASGFYSPYGLISLNWAYQPSGVFRWATQDRDAQTGLPLYQTSQTESVYPQGLNNSPNTPVFSYYTYNAPGVLVKVTRTAGSTGRAWVYYSTVDGSSIAVPTNDVAAHSQYENIISYVDADGNPTTDQFGNTNEFAFYTGDYQPVGGTLVFDDGEMSKTILIPINSGGGYVSNPFYTTNKVTVSTNLLGVVSTNYIQLPSHNNNNLYNADFGVVLSGSQLDPLESSDVSQPRVDPTFSTAMVKILNSAADPYGPDYVSQLSTNFMVGTSNVVSGGVTNVVTVTNAITLTNLVLALSPTNTIFNFEKATYRVPEDVTTPGIQGNYAQQVTLWVERFGTNTSAQTINYRINNYLGVNEDVSEEQNIEFPASTGFGLCRADSAATGFHPGEGSSDFNMVQGTISFSGHRHRCKLPAHHIYRHQQRPHEVQQGFQDTTLSRGEQCAASAVSA